MDIGQKPWISDKSQEQWSQIPFVELAQCYPTRPMNSLDSTATFHIKGYRDMRLDWWSNHCTGGKHSPTAAIGVKLVNWIFINKSSIYTGLPAVQESLKSPGICKYFSRALLNSFILISNGAKKETDIGRYVYSNSGGLLTLRFDFEVTNKILKLGFWTIKSVI